MTRSESDLYVSGGRPCSEMFARQDGRNPRTAVVTDPRRLRGRDYRGMRVNIVQGWWVNKTLGEVSEWMYELGAVKAMGGEVVDHYCPTSREIRERAWLLAERIDRERFEHPIRSQTATYGDIRYVQALAWTMHQEWDCELVVR